MEDAVCDNWEDLLEDDAAFDKIVQLKDDGFDDEDVEPDQLEVQQEYVSTGPAKPSEKKLLQKERKRKMMEKLENTKKKYEENAFGNIMLPQDKRNLKLQQHLFSQKQDELNIASLVGDQQQQNEELQIPPLQFPLSTKENIQLFETELKERLKPVEVKLLQEMVVKGIEQGLKELGWSSKETGKMFEKARTFLVMKEKKERSNKKDKKKQAHVNLSKAASKKLAVEDEDDSEEEDPAAYEIIESDQEEKKEELEKAEEGSIYQKEMHALKLDNSLNTLGFIVRCFQLMKLIAEEKNKKDWSVQILVTIMDIACEGSQSKDWKESVMEKIKDVHNLKMNEEKGITNNNKKKNPFTATVNAGKATENEIAQAVEEDQQQQQEDEFDPDEDFM